MQFVFANIEANLSGKTIDRRVARTRSLLQRALLNLLQAKPYEEITVGEICDAAGVGRSSFYAHFVNKDDLKRSGLEHLRSELLEWAAQASDGAAEPTLFQFAEALFMHAKQHDRLHLALKGGRGGEVSMQAIREILRELVQRDLAKRQFAARDRVIRVCAREIVVGSLLSLLAWSLEEGREISPSAINAAFHRITTNGLASIHGD